MKAIKFSGEQAVFTISTNVEDHSNDPFVMKKNEEALKSIQRDGVIEQMVKIRSKLKAK